jgi:hypothetical protein
MQGYKKAGSGPGWEKSETEPVSEANEYLYLISKETYA